MFNLLNKSVKTINNGISTFISNITSESNYKTEIDFVKFGNLNLNLLKLSNLKEIENSIDSDFYFKDFNVLYVVYSKYYLNIYYLNDDLDFLCFFNQKFNYPIEKVGSVLTSTNIFCSDKVPLIGIITNKEPNNSCNDFSNIVSTVNFRGNTYQGLKNDHNIYDSYSNTHTENENNFTEYCLKIYSLKTNKIVINLRKKIKIDNFISNKKILGISFVNGRIEIFNTINFEKLLKIKGTEYTNISKDRIKGKIGIKKTNNYNNNIYQTSNNNLKINYIKDKNEVKSKLNDNNEVSSEHRLHSALFDITEDYIIFYNYNNIYSIIPSKKVSVNNKNRKKNDSRKNTSRIEDYQRCTNIDYNIYRENLTNEKKKKEFSKIKNIPNKKSNSLSKTEILGSRNSSLSKNNRKFKNSDANNLKYKFPNQFKKVNKNGINQNYLNINYINDNDLYRQTSNPIENEFDKYNYKLDENHNSSSALDIISTDIYERISKLTNWSFSQINDFKNLHHASNFSNNSNLKVFSCSSILTIAFFNYEEIQNADYRINNNIDEITLDLNVSKKNPLNNIAIDSNNKNNNNLSNNSSNIKIKDLNKNEKERENQKIYIHFCQNNIYIPFFNDGISTLQFLNKGKYFIVGNKNSQMFYIYENFPATNLKHNSDEQAKKSIFKNKISYSVFRGITKGIINNIDLSSCNKYLIISSNKGTFHLFNIPKKNDLINENSSLFNYEFYNENNNRIVNAINIDKIKYSGFIENCGNYIYKTTSKLLSGFKIDVEELETEIKKNIIKSNFAKKIYGNLLVNFSEYDKSVNIHLIHDDNHEKNEDSSINLNLGSFNYNYNNSGFYTNNNSINHRNGKEYLNLWNIKTNQKSNFSNITSNSNNNFGIFGNLNSEKKEKIYQLKKIDLSESLIKFNANYKFGNGNFFSEKINEINTNFKNLLHKNKLNYIKQKHNLKHFIDKETTTRNFPTLQTHPLFTFNFYKNQKINLNNLNNNSILNLNYNSINNNCNNLNNLNHNCNYCFDSYNIYNNIFQGNSITHNSNKNTILGFNSNNINNFEKNKHSRNNHNSSLTNNLNSNNSNCNFQIIPNLNSNHANYNINNSNTNPNLNSFVNISSSGINKDDSNTDNLEIIIDKDKKDFSEIQSDKDFTNVENIHISHNCESKDKDLKNKDNDCNNLKGDININNNKYKEDKKVKIFKNEKSSNKTRKNINLKYKKPKIYENTININSSSYSLCSSKDKVDISIENEKKEINFNVLEDSNTIKHSDENDLKRNLSQNQEKSEEKKVRELEIPQIDTDLDKNRNIENSIDKLDDSNEENKLSAKSPIKYKKEFCQISKILINNRLNNVKERTNSNEDTQNIHQKNNANLSKNSILSGRSINENIEKNQNLNKNNYNIINNPFSNKIDNYNNNKNIKKSFDSTNLNNINSNNNNCNSNNYNLNLGAIDNLIAEKIICNDLEYFEINFESNKQIHNTDFFLDYYIGPKLIINPFDNYQSNNSSRKNTKENNDLKSENNKDKLTMLNKNREKINEQISVNKEKENHENSSMHININSINNAINDDFYNNKECLLRKKIQEAINGNIMDRIVSSSDTIVKFSGEIKIDEDYIKK